MEDDPQSSWSRQAKTSDWLHVAAEIGDFNQIDRIFSSLDENDLQDERLRLLNLVSKGELPSHCAARGGFTEILKFLLPEDLPELTNAQCQNGGWSPLHFAAAYGHASTVQWLIAVRMADLNVQDGEGNTPVHLAVLLGHRHVARYLATDQVASLFILNRDRMMPVSYCKDPSMFEALSFMLGSTSHSFYRAVNTLDAKGRSILHYAAQFTILGADKLAKLIAGMNPDELEHRDHDGDSFLHIAAKSGNTQILLALQRLGSVHIDVPRLMSISSHDPLHSPGLLALLHDNSKFFDELLTVSKVEIPLSCIIEVLGAELTSNPGIQQRLALFATTLPTYLALYANKYTIYDFLLKTNIISLSQRDDEYKRTCLHWAVLDKRTDIIQKIHADVRVRPGIQDRDGKTALHLAFEQNNHMVMDILRARSDFKDHEENLYRDREVYAQALNAILVGAALIVSVTFAGWLQWPSSAAFMSMHMKIFWATNSISFFTALATMCVTTAALLPTPRKYVGHIVKKMRLAIVVDAGLLALSLLAVLFAFVEVGFAAVRSSNIFTYQSIMTATTVVGGFLYMITWAAFLYQIYMCTPPMSDLVALMLPHPFCQWLPLVWPRFVDTSRSFSGYRNLSRGELGFWMERDLVEQYNQAMQLIGAPGAHAPHAAPDATPRILSQRQLH